jgi:hypothetical protein
MPLVGYHLINFNKKPISFTASDYNLLKSNEHPNRAERFFSRSPHSFNLIFHNARLPITKNDLNRYKHTRNNIGWFLVMFGRVGGWNRWNLEWSRQQQKHIFLKGNVHIFNHNAINIVYTSNVTDSPIIPFTPHIMAHRMGHMHMLCRENIKFMSFLEQWGNLVLTNYYNYNILADKCHSVIATTDFQDRVYGWGKNPHMDALWWNAIFKYLTTTRAGRKRQVSGWEYIPEWFAQYINLGKLNFPSELPEKIVLEEIYKNDTALEIPVPVGELCSPHQSRYSTKPFSHQIEKYFEEILQGWRGELIVT